MRKVDEGASGEGEGVGGDDAEEWAISGWFGCYVAKQFGRIGPNSFRESAFSHCFAFREACHAGFHLAETVFLVESFFAR